MSKVLGILVLALLVVSGACAPAAPKPEVSQTEGYAPSGAKVAPAPPAQAKPGELPLFGERMIVRTANMTLIVTDPTEIADKVTDLAKSVGGYVSSSSTKTNEDRPSVTITIRVPASAFDEVRRALRGMASTVKADDVRSQDVTEEYTDLESQLRNLEATEEQYRQLLKQATTVDDILKVQQRLSEVRGQIERVKGRKLFLERTVEMSAITIALLPKAAEVSLEVAGWHPLTTVRTALRALLLALQVVSYVVIWLLIVVLPLGLLIGLPSWLGWREWRRRRVTRPSAK
ncbi:MAG: DUF4349 domain-containing protein [Chloroflexi bacterium]|nr:DUF4349 domain-containing protein [Chloroflexota bacterium]MCL5075198.1 DUF4349 domain-containing protein [Chloroflexota bacterium]